MTFQSVRILQAPTPEIFKDDTAHYRLLLELYNRSGGYQSSSQDLKGLTASVRELNTLDGINLDSSVQQQLSSKLTAGALGDMAYQHANNVSITGGSILNPSISDANINSSSFVDGTISNSDITTPTGSSVIALSNGVINTNYTQTGSVGAGETNLLSYSLIANTLSANSFLEIIGFGSFAANANNKQLKLKFESTTIYDSTALALNAGYWKINCIISMISSSIEKCVTEISSSNALLTNSINYVQATENLAANLNILFTGTGTADNDIVQEGLIIKYYKG